MNAFEPYASMNLTENAITQNKWDRLGNKPNGARKKTGCIMQHLQNLIAWVSSFEESLESIPSSSMINSAKHVSYDRVASGQQASIAVAVDPSFACLMLPLRHPA